MSANCIIWHHMPFFVLYENVIFVQFIYVLGKGA